MRANGTARWNNGGTSGHKAGIQRERVIMKSPKRRKPVFEQLKKGLEEAIRHARGEITLKTTTLEMPDPVFRKAKAKAAERGIPFRQFVTEAVEEKLHDAKSSASKPWPSTSTASP